jgi:predicted PurR-regulated permease PerM
VRVRRLVESSSKKREATTSDEKNLDEESGASTIRRRRTWPTPIWVPKLVRNVVIGVAVLALLAALVFVAWRVPSALIIAVGGFALATVLSAPVRGLSRIMPRRSRGLAVLTTFLAIVGLIVAGSLLVVPQLTAQFAMLSDALPLMADAGRHYLLVGLELLDGWGLLPGTPEHVASRIEGDLSNSVGAFTGGMLGDPFALVSGVFGLVVSLFGVVFVGAYLLVDTRRIKAAYLMRVPLLYRHDARDLWNAFEHSFSRYMSGLLLDLLIQGAVSALVLYLIGVPYALALGAWVSLTALIPYFGAWLGAIPAVILAFTISPLKALLTLIAFFVIQQVEGNFLLPRIQGQALHIHPVPILLAVIVGWGLFGIVGMVLAIPALAVVRVLYDFFSIRIRTGE